MTPTAIKEGLAALQEGKRIGDHAAVEQKDRDKKRLADEQHMALDRAVTGKRGIDCQPGQEGAHHFMDTDQLGPQRGHKSATTTNWNSIARP